MDCVGQIPPPRKDHTAVVFGDYMYVFGGDARSTTLNDFYCINLKGDVHEWKRIMTAGPNPPARAGHSAVVLGNSMYIFGGHDSHSSYSPFQGLQCQCSYEDEWRACPACMGGGELESKVYDDLWEFSYETWTWRNEPKTTGQWPTPRSSHISVGNNNVLYIISGNKTTWPEIFEGPLLEVWCWDIRQRVWYQMNCTGEQPKDMFHGKGVRCDQHVYVFNDENAGKKHVYRLNLHTSTWEKCNKVPELDWTHGLLDNFEYNGMSVAVVQGKAVMHGHFSNNSGIAAPLQKNLLVCNLDNF